MEQSKNELTWSAGDKLASDTVVKAFKLDDKKDLLQRDDPGPFVAAKGLGCGTLILIAVVLIILLVLLSNCSGSPGAVTAVPAARSVAFPPAVGTSKPQGEHIMMGIEWLRPAAFSGPCSTR